MRESEPSLRQLPAILVPSTGILDAAKYVKALARYVESRGVTLLLNCLVNSAGAQKLETSRGEIPFDLAINSAGLGADQVAVMAGLSGYTIRPCRGDYFLLRQRRIKRPVYHLPYKGAHGLGVHLTPTVSGETLVGPNAFFIEGKEDYRHQSDLAPFEKSVRFYLPYEKKSLSPAYSGNRPKLFHFGDPLPEFTLIKKDNWIHLLGIESPGLTAAPALAERVRRLITS